MHLRHLVTGSRTGARRLGLASAIAVAVAAPASAAPIVGLTGSNTLVGFDSAAPGTVTSTVGVTGLGGDTLRGIDFRPSNGALYGLGSSGTLYVIDSATGAAVAIGPGVPIAGGSADVGFGFNPVPDAIRVVTPSDQNFRVNPTTGLTTTDGPLAFGAGDPNAGVNPSVATSAYTNQVAGTVTSTTLYGIDAATGSLVLQAPPNAGTLTTIGLLGISNFGPGPFGFDIEGTTNAAFASVPFVGGSAGLYSINLGTGAATLLGSVGFALNDIATGRVGAVAVPEPASLALFGAGLLGLLGVRRRRA